MPQTLSRANISIKHSATGYSAIFNDAKRTRIATAFLQENSLTFQKSSGKESAPSHAELQKRSEGSKKDLTLRVSINVFCSSFFLYCKRSPCFSLEIFSLIPNIIFENQIFLPFLSENIKNLLHIKVKTIKESVFYLSKKETMTKKEQTVGERIDQATHTFSEKLWAAGEWTKKMAGGFMHWWNNSSLEEKITMIIGVILVLCALWQLRSFIWGIVLLLVGILAISGTFNTYLRCGIDAINSKAKKGTKKAEKDEETESENE